MSDHAGFKPDDCPTCQRNRRFWRVANTILGLGLVVWLLKDCLR